MLYKLLAASLLLAHSHALVLDAAPRVVPAVAAARAAPAVMMPKKKNPTNKLVDVLLDADVEGVGEKGALVKVKPAFAENVLLSKGLGTRATKEMLERLAAEKAEAEAAAAAAKQSALEIRARLMDMFGSGLVTEAQVSKSGQLEQPMTSDDLVLELKRRGVGLSEPSLVEMPAIVDFGSAVAEITLHPEVTLSLKVAVEKSKIRLG